MVSRPYIFSVVVFALEFFLLESYKERNRRVFLYFLPALSVLLINLHAAMWPMFFVFAIPYIIETIKFKVGPIVNGGAEKKWLYFTVLLSVPAGLINPYGVEAMIYGIKSYGHGEINGLVSEMRPLTIDTMFGKLMFVLMLIVPVIYFTYRRGTLKLRYVLLAMGTAYMALSSRRNIILFALCAYFPLASYLKDFTIVIKKQSNEKKVRKLRITLAVLLVIALPFGFYAAYISNKPVADEYVLLNAAIDRILAKHEPREVILYTGYNEGNLAEFRGLKTYMDARAEVFLIKNNKKEDVFHEYYNLYANKLYFSAFLDKYNFTHILLPQDGAFTEHLNYENKYSLVYSNEKYCLYEINDDDTAAVDIES